MSDSRLIPGHFVAYMPELARQMGNPIRAIILQALWFARDHNTDETTMSYAVLSERTGVSERTLRDHTKWLRDHGHLSSRRRSTMDATQVWSVHLDGEPGTGEDDADPDPADSAASSDGPETADPAASTDAPAHTPAETADPAASIRQISPHLDAADSAASLSVEEELTTKNDGGAVGEVPTEQQQRHNECDATDAGVPRAISPVPPFPRWATSHRLLIQSTPQQQQDWWQAWVTVHGIESVQDRNLSLTHYLARCGELRKSPSPHEWVRWFTEDEGKERRRITAEQQRARQETAGRPTNPWFE